MKPIVCFIDDSSFEHELVSHEIAPSAPDLEFVQTTTFGANPQTARGVAIN